LTFFADGSQIIVWSDEGDPRHGLGGREGLEVGRQLDEAADPGGLAEDVGGAGRTSSVHHYHRD
jgi:hypothetical protein